MRALSLALVACFAVVVLASSEAEEVSFVEVSTTVEAGAVGLFRYMACIAQRVGCTESNRGDG